MITFEELGVKSELCETIKLAEWDLPTDIQKESIPMALAGRDIVALASTGSGKTGAFVIPIIQGLIEKKQEYYALILTPTRELALQIKSTIVALGKGFGIRVAELIGGCSEKEQVKQIKRNPHIIVASPGRMIKHIQKTREFSVGKFSNLQFLVFDEADKMLSSDFEKEIHVILRFAETENRQTFLFSATNTTKLEKLQRACVKNPAIIQVSNKFSDKREIKEYTYLMIPPIKCGLLLYLLKSLTGIDRKMIDECDQGEITLFSNLGLYNLSEQESKEKSNRRSVIVFTNLIDTCNALFIFLNEYGIRVAKITGEMTQPERNSSVNKIKTRAVDVLVATDVLARGIDIPNIDVVINYEMPSDAKTYTHRIGRTGRAGAEGHAILLFEMNDNVEFCYLKKKLERNIPHLMSTRNLLKIHNLVLNEQSDIKFEWGKAKHSSKTNRDDGRGKKRKAININVDSFKKQKH